MKILFLHPNFPAQFKSACMELRNKGHQIKFICQTHYGRNLSGIEKLVLKGGGSYESTLKSGKNEVDQILFRANAYRQSFIQLKNQGWNPDVIVSHSGWGCGMYAKEIWAETHLISYLEWWFDITSDFIHSLKKSKYFHFNEESFQKFWDRNTYASIEMCSSDRIITPTSWQRMQLPKLLREHCQVVPDVVNKDLFFPEPRKLSSIPKVTYGTRGMEPMRGFPQFIQLLPMLLNKWPQLVVEIAGEDSISYGGKLPKEKSWKKWALKILENEGLTHRVNWLGRMPLEDYSNWLKTTWCHIYLSEPFVTSWSYIEAMHCKIPMIASSTKAGLEFKLLNENCEFVNHNCQAEMLAAVNDKIRFLSNSACTGLNIREGAQAKMQVLSEPRRNTLASLIADVEATTKV